MAPLGINLDQFIDMNNQVIRIKPNKAQSRPNHWYINALIR